MKKLFTFSLILFLTISYLGINAQSNNVRINHSIIKQELLQNQTKDFDKQIKTSSKSTALDYGSTPNLNWKMQFGGSAFDNINSVISDNSGNIYVAGSFYDQMTLSSNVYTSTGNREAFVAKFNSSGGLVWLTQIAATANNETYANDLCIGANGNIFVTGYYTGALSVGSSTLPNMNNYSMFYAKINSSGSIQDGGYHSVSSNEIGLYINTDASGNIYTSIAISMGTGSRHASYLVKFNSSNTQVYANQYDIGFNDFTIEGNSIYYSGVIQQGDNGVIDPNVTLPQPPSYNDVFITKSDLNGVFDWGFSAGHPGYGDSMDDRIDFSNNNLYLMGTFRSSIAFGIDTVISSSGSFLTQIDTLGNVQWLQTHESFGSNVSLTTDNSGNAYAVNGSRVGKYSSAGTLIWSNIVSNKPTAINYTSNDKIISVGSVDGLNFLAQYSNAPTEEWTAQFGGTSATSTVYGLRADNNGSIYSYGYSSGDVVFNGTALSAGLYVSKQKGDGTLLWAKEFNKVPQRNTVGNLIIMDPNNQHLYISGSFTDSLIIPNQSPLIAGSDGSTFIIKYDINGGFIWAKKEDFVGEGYSLTIDNSDNVILTGTFIDTISIGSAVLQSAGSEDCFIVKYNSSSAFQWAKRAGGEYVEYTSLVSTDANDNIYISGEYVSETVTIGSYSFPMLAGEGNVLLAKLNPNGGVIWAKSFGDIDDATNWWDEVTWPTGIITDDNGNTYIKGNLSYEGKFDNIKLENSDSYFNKFIAKIDSSGTALWAKGIYQPVQSHNFDYNQFDIDDEGNVYFGMQAKTILNFGTAYQYSPTSNSDLFIAKYSTIGDLEWVKTMEGIDYGYTWISSVAVYDTANVFVAGFFRNQLAIDGAIMNSNIYHGFISMLGPNIITGFKDIYNNNSSKIEIFPNPTSDNISFVTDKNITNAIINIYSINGALIKTQTINSNAVNVSKLSKGIYIVKITSEKGKVYLSKFVKN